MLSGHVPSLCQRCHHPITTVEMPRHPPIPPPPLPHAFFLTLIQSWTVILFVSSFATQNDWKRLDMETLHTWLEMFSLGWLGSHAPPALNVRLLWTLFE